MGLQQGMRTVIDAVGTRRQRMFGETAEQEIHRQILAAVMMMAPVAVNPQAVVSVRVAVVRSEIRLRR